MPTPVIRMVAVDLDGTLLDDAKRIAPATRDAVLRLRSIGIPFIIASARPPRSVRHIHADLKLHTLQINYNGALIWDEAQQQVNDHRPMSGELVLEIVRFARAIDPQTMVTCEILDKWHTDRFDDAYSTETSRLFRPDVIAPVESFCCGPVTKLLLLGPPEVILPMQPRVVEAFADRITMIRTDSTLLQIMADGVSKATALQRIARHYHIPLSHTLAIGDGENDIEMLAECGVGVAVANADDRVKQAANWVTTRPNSQGVLEALQRYIPPLR